MRRMTMGLGVVAMVAVFAAPFVQVGNDTVVEEDVVRPPPERKVEQRVSEPVAVQPATEGPQAVVDVVDLVFVVDTTSSMGGLLEGAKQTIWQVLDTVVSEQPQPTVRVGVVAYRDRGDAYVTTTFPLSADLDEAHAFVKALRPAGGGDGPESMARALQEAVDTLDWTPSPDAYRAVFVVADAPDHAYPDEAPVGQTAARARQQGLVVHGILAGSNRNARRDLSALAGAGGGDFFAVPQDGGAVAVSTPYDAELDRVERALASNGLAYANAQGEQYAQKVEANWANSLSTRAARRSTLSKQGAGVASGGGDLVQDLLGGRVLSDVADEELPIVYQRMTPAEREADVARRVAERQALAAEVASITADRDAWVAAERNKRKTGGATGFDVAVEAATVGRMRR